MHQKLIVTLWKAQLKELNKEDSIYCRLTYNNTQRNSKPTTHQKNLAWKQTFIFPLARRQSPLKLQFIGLKEGQAIHFAKDQVAQSMSFGKSLINIEIDSPHQGSLPCKVDILDKQEESVGKVFIEYEVMKTEVAYTVEKQLDYFYLLKLTNFRVNFVRKLRNTPKFYLHFNIEGRQQKQDLPFQESDGGVFVYNYPAKIYLKKEIQMEIVLFMNDSPEIDYQYTTRKGDYQSQSSFSQSLFSQKKTFKSSVGKKQKQLLQIGKEKIVAIMDLSFKKDTKVTKKLPLTTILKFQKRQIGTIEFQAEVYFRSKQQLQELQEQKKGLNPQKQLKPLQRKKNVVKPTNGLITVNSILGKLQLFNDSIIENKDISVDLKLGNQIKQSTILQKPGKELIFIDTFVFKRTWQETIKFIINIHNSETQKIPTFYADLNLRQLFQLGRYISKKIKLKDQNKNYSGELTLDLIYKEIQEKKSPSIKQEMASISEIPQEQVQQNRAKMKRQEIERRMRKRQQQKEKVRELNSMSTLAVLQNNDIILPPLKSISRMTTLSPKNQKMRGANMFNVNGSIKIPKSPRFVSAQRPGYESFTYVRESDFDVKKKKGTYIGYGNKHDFTKVLAPNPGVGRYEIPSVWDKYK